MRTLSDDDGDQYELNEFFVADSHQYMYGLVPLPPEKQGRNTTTLKQIEYLHCNKIVDPFSFEDSIKKLMLETASKSGLIGEAYDAFKNEVDKL